MPIAIAGRATLLVAALAMSGFSVLVAANDVRPCRLLLLGASMVHSPFAGVCGRSRIFSCIAADSKNPVKCRMICVTGVRRSRSATLMKPGAEPSAF
ncbi:MAG: hypothetical protein ACJ8D4_12495 [Xanthobacteraceae bacterium]